MLFFIENKKIDLTAEKLTSFSYAYFFKKPQKPQILKNLKTPYPQVFTIFKKIKMENLNKIFHFDSIKESIDIEYSAVLGEYHYISDQIEFIESVFKKYGNSGLDAKLAKLETFQSSLLNLAARLDIDDETRDKCLSSISEDINDLAVISDMLDGLTITQKLENLYEQRDLFRRKNIDQKNFELSMMFIEKLHSKAVVSGDLEKICNLFHKCIKILKCYCEKGHIPFNYPEIFISWNDFQNIFGFDNKVVEDLIEDIGERITQFHNSNIGYQIFDDGICLYL